MNNKIKLWETCLLVSVCISLCCGVRAQAQQSLLTENIIRLHVVAVSDDAAEQAVKLRVRDAVSVLIAPALADCDDAQQANLALTVLLPSIEQAALANSCGRAVTVSFGREQFPAREGDGYSLPAGVYTTLRVRLGSGEGHNWWGVIFPQLTAGATGGSEQAVNVLGEGGVKLISGEGSRRELRFKVLDWLGEIQSGADE